MAADQKIVYMNARDERGWPICPACDKPISPDDNIARSRPYLAHRACWDRMLAGKRTRLNQPN